MAPSLRLLPLGLALLGPLPGCATAALNAALRAAHPEPPWNGEVAISTTPAGAACRVMRGEEVVAEVASTPGTVRLERSHRELELRCRHPGHLETVEVLRPSDDPAVFRMAPNGIIGATATVFSLASARTMRYPSAAALALIPDSFPSEAAREAWFATRREAIIARRAARLALADERCRAGQTETCDPEIQVMQRQQADELARLEMQHAGTRIAEAGPAGAAAGF